MKKKIILLLLVVLLASGCGKSPKLVNGKEAVAELKESSITVDDLYEEMKVDYALGKLIDMVDKEILTKKFPTNDEENKYIEDEIAQAKQYYDSYYKLQFSTYEQFIGQYYGARDDAHLREILSLANKKKRATEDYAERTITDKEIKKYYDEKFIGEMEASHILITVDADQYATEEDKKKAEEKALNEAKDIIKKLDKGEKFEDLAKKYSKDGSAEAGGKLGKFAHKTMVEEFEVAAYKLKEGEYSKAPVKTQFGYHIILKTKQYAKKELKDVEKDIKKYVADEKIASDNLYTYKALIEIRKENNMVINDPKIKEQYNNYVYNVTK